MTDSIKNTLNEGFNTLKNFTEQDNTSTLIAIVIIVAILFSLLSWIFYTLRLKGTACNKMNAIYTSRNVYKLQGAFHISNIKPNFSNNNVNVLNNHYILTAYNCCCGDGYKNNFVNLCALEKCIFFGARCLDFEIYSYNGEPIVAASTANNNSIKETYNYIPLVEVFDILNIQSFNDQYTQCANDPMFLHLRIMSENKIIYDKMGDYIEKYLNSESDYLLTENIYKYTNTNKNDLLLQPLVKFKKKFIIMVNTLHSSILNSSKLAKYVNIKSGSETMKLERYEKLIASGNYNSFLIDDSKTNFVMILPDISTDINNFDPIGAFTNGCQFIGMKFQNLDTNLEGYLNHFKDSGNFSFCLKPLNLRRDIIEAETPADDLPLNPQREYPIGIQ